MSTLTIQNLHAQVEEKSILKGVDLTLSTGKIAALMGPNGSGKSTLGSIIAGHPSYEVTKGSIKLSGKNILDLQPDQRALSGIFLSFQHPLTIPGVPLANFLKAAIDTHREHNKLPKLSALEFFNKLKEYAKILSISEDFLRKPVNDGLSGGERKKIETLQLLVLEPSWIILDELDTGTDVDTLKLIGETVSDYAHEKFPVFFTKSKRVSPAILIITHYNRIFKYIKPEIVHVIKSGQIVKTGDYSLVKAIETKGYDQF